jgi:hypothetical protein
MGKDKREKEGDEREGHNCVTTAREELTCAIS